MLPRKTSLGGFTLIEALVVIAVLAVLAAFLIPITSRIRDRANETASFNNLRQIGNALSLYVSEHGGNLPLLAVDYKTDFWAQSLSPYTKTKEADPDIFIRRERSTVSQVFFDPTLENGDHHMLGDYGANNLVFLTTWPSRDETTNPMSIYSLNDTANLITVMAAESQYSGRMVGSWYVTANWYLAANGNIPTSRPSDRGRGSIHTLFADGHVSAIPKDEFVENREQLLRP